jgi:Putative Na+/H+ antiporter
VATLVDRAHIAPFNVVATAIFFCAILHTFLAARVAAAAHHVQHRHDEHRRALGLPPAPNVRAELLHFLGEVEVGWKAVLAVIVSAPGYYLAFRREFNALSLLPAVPEIDRSEDGVDAASDVGTMPVPPWVTLVHALFIVWTVVNAHYPALFMGGFLFFLGFARATRPFQSPIDLKPPLLVGFFLAGLVIHGGLSTLASHGCRSVTERGALQRAVSVLLPKVTRTRAG